jgi:methionyl-tRNA formyltransferase
MRVVLFANNWVGWKVAERIRAAGDEIVAVVAHPAGRRRYGDETLAAAGIDADRVIDGATLRDPGVPERLAALGADFGVSAFFGYILRKPVIDAFASGVVNVHPALLPYNRGSYPNVWSIIEGTPAGVTVHYIDEGVDTGDVIAQREVAVGPTDTGASLYRRLEEASVELFAESWALLREGRAPRSPQPTGGTSHKIKDVERIDEVDLGRNYTGRELIDLLRARTFPGYRGAYFVKDGRRVYLELSLRYEDEGAGK